MKSRLALGLFAVGLLTLSGAGCSAGSEGGKNDSDGDKSSSGSSSAGDGDGDSSSVNGDGSIAGGVGDGASGDGDGDGTTKPGICASYTAVSKPVTPVVLLLLDQSGSMGEPRWGQAKSALTTSATNLEADAHVGFIGFPLHGYPQPTDTVDINVYAETCGAHMKVAPGANTAQAIVNSIAPQAPTTGVGHTPVRAALDLARSEFGKTDYADMSKYVILITDGAPNCASSNVGSFWKREDPSDTVTAMAAEGITTYVVGYQLSSAESDGITPTIVADNMAKAGGTGSYRDVSDGSTLSAALDEIGKAVVSCSFDLDEAPQGGASFVRVTLDSVDYALGIDWNMEGERTVALVESGPACAVLRDGGEHEVTIQVECEPVIVK